MKHDEYNKILLKNGIGRKQMFGKSTNICFDSKHKPQSKEVIRQANSYAMSNLGWYVYTPESGDCDTFVVLWLGYMLTWLLQNVPSDSSYDVGMVWGKWEGLPHAWGFAINDQGKKMFFNYGKEVFPTRYKSFGSFTI